MKSQWYKLKSQAIDYRKQGYSLRMVEKELGIPRSTLSYWFRDVSLTRGQKMKLRENWKGALGKARLEAVKWHNEQKRLRLETAQKSALQSLSKIDINQKEIIEVALAMLYLGEGGKASPETSLGSSSPLILKFFIHSLRRVYKLDITKLRCDLHLRADQNPTKLISFWAKELRVPLSCFKGFSLDQRTKGSQTYDSYKGVCVIKWGNAAVQRKLMFMAQAFCQQV